MKIHVMIATMLVMGWSCLPLAAQEEFDDNLFEEDGLVEFKYNPNPNRIRLKSTISDELAARLKAGESVTVRVPADQQQVISSMILRKPEFFKSKLLSIRPRTRMVDGNVLIPIPIQIIDRLDYQPIELKIFQSNVNRATLIPVNDPNTQNSLTSKVLTPDFFVRLKPDNGVTVAFTNLNSFKLQNEWFEFEFPFAEIEAIFFDQDQSDQASVVLKNGDSVSGKHFWPDNVEFETPWGKEDIELAQVVSVTRDKSVKLVLSGVENPKYILLRQNNQYTPRR